MNPARGCFSVLFVVLGLSGPADAQQNWDEVVVEAHPVVGNIYMLTGSGGNIGVSVGEDGILIVDDQYAPLADKIKSVLRGLHAGPLKFVLNTHFHGDHVGGNPIFGLEATIIAHTNVHKRLSTPHQRGVQTIPAMVEDGWPVITFDDEVSVHFNGEEIRLVHMPGAHTDNDSYVYFTGSNVVHMGDTFFNGRFPFVDLRSGGTVDGLIRNIAEVLEIIGPDTRVIPGHGDLGVRADLQTYHGMIVATTDAVRAMMAEGKTLDEITAAGLPDEWSGYASDFVPEVRWIETIFNSYGSAE
ncbi:MAG: MBL fold metallo-hydrolase [Gemmatimonadetes bacterium]|nr:MBL fold metallo-hydrolase [Gemmatimonadota bacterium]MYB60830.1 MBL fold metallo-hydrolase [Gemmatimonadota bacterium]